MNSKISQIEFDKFCENFTVKMSKKGERVLDFKGTKFTISFHKECFFCNFSKLLKKKASGYFYFGVYPPTENFLAEEMFVEFENGLKQTLRSFRNRCMRYAQPRKRQKYNWNRRSWNSSTYNNPKTKEKHLKSAKFYEDLYFELFNEQMPTYHFLQ